MLALVAAAGVMLQVAAAPAAPPNQRATATTSTKEKDEEDEEKPARKWYGWQILVPDAAALALCSLGAATIDSNRSVGRPVLTIGEAVFLAGGPVIHAAHGQSMRFVGSIGM